MAAGLGFKTFTTGEVLTAADVNGYLMQGVLVFASAAARDAAITSPQEGQFAFTKDTNGLWYYDGAAWVASGATGDIEGVTAGTGISGGGTSGTVTITNSMATAIDAKGDLVAGTGADAFSRLGVGANNTVLTADSAQATGLKWATPAGASFTTARSFVATVEGTTSSSYTTLSTAVSVTITTGTKALVMISGKCANGGASNKGAQIGFAISGSTTVAASDEYSIGFSYIGIANPFNMYAAGAFLVTGLTAGSNTFAQRYKNPEGGTDSYFGDRTISVIDLGS